MLKLNFRKACCLVTIGITHLLMCISCENEIKNTIAPTPVTVMLDTKWWDAIGQNDIKLVENLHQSDSALFAIINQAILQNPNPDSFGVTFSHYIQDDARKKLKDTCDIIFKNIDLEKKLKDPFGRIKTSFPEYQLPKIVPILSDFNYGIFLFEQSNGEPALAFGKEMYMGHTALYDQLSIANPNFSSYINRTFNTDHLPAKIVQAIASDIVEEPRNNKLIDHILYEGKKLYMIKAWLPDIPDSVWFETTPKQFDWVKKNELDMWRFLLDEKTLYKISGKLVADLTQPAPHSQGMPTEAPGRAINYIGYQIVRKYIQETNVSLKELAYENDYDKILQLSKYKPR